MKQRFSSLDVTAIAHELSTSLVSLRVSNIYDLSSKILLFKFAKPQVKKQLLIDSGFRCHLTEFTRLATPTPSVFASKLRKGLKTRRVTAVSQIGTDRIIELQFSDGQYRLFLEFFASGNVILTDKDLKILTLLRNVPEGDGQEAQAPGLQYSIEKRQNHGGIPPLEKARVRAALEVIAERNRKTDTTGKKIKRKPGDELRRGLATTLTEFPPVLVEHALASHGFNATLPAPSILENDELLDQLFEALREARKIVDGVNSSTSCPGYIFAKPSTSSKGLKALADNADNADNDRTRAGGLLYDDFHPYIPKQLQNNSSCTVLSFESFNKAVDEFFSSIEDQKLELRRTERETTAKLKLDAAKRDQARRIEGLQEVQLLNEQKAQAIEANAERVQEALDAVNGLIAQGMDWVDIQGLLERERSRNNPVAMIIGLPLKLSENTVTLLLDEAEEEEEDEEEANETDSSASGDDAFSDSGHMGTSASRQKARDRRLAIDVDLGLSPWANARNYHGEKKSAAGKEERTKKQSQVALKNAEQKIAAELKKGLKQEKPTLSVVRQYMPFEKFNWFISSDGYLVIGGKDAPQNETLYRSHLKKGDRYVHADLAGASTVVVKNKPQTPDAPIPPATLSQAGTLAVCSSSAWESKSLMPAWWVNAEQVSKLTSTKDILPPGIFTIRGEKNFLPPVRLELGFGLFFKISEESKAKHQKHRLRDATKESTSVQTATDTSAKTTAFTSGTAGSSVADIAEQSDVEMDEDDDENSHDGEEDVADRRGNPLQSDALYNRNHAEVESSGPLTESIDHISIKGSETEQSLDTGDVKSTEGSVTEAGEHAEQQAEPNSTPHVQENTSKEPQQQNMKSQQQFKRGQKGKAKKIAAKYRDQDDEDRAAIEALIGASAGQQRAEAEAQVKADREAALQAAKERRRAQHERHQREAAEHEALRAKRFEEGREVDEEEVGAVDDENALEFQAEIDTLVGMPHAGDEILEVVPFCAPYGAMTTMKYKAKLQPGSAKKGKAVKEVLAAWQHASEKRGTIDDSAMDRERMWPREADLIKALRPEEAFNTVPVGKLKVVMSGLIGGGDKSKGKGKTGGGGGGGGGGKGKGKGKK